MNSTPFISWIGHGAASLAPSGVFTGVRAYVFVFRASKDAMQRMADRFLNAAAGGKVTYKAFTRRAVVLFGAYDKCTSDVDQIGWVPGRESAIFVPLLEFDGGFPRLVLWSPYIYIDYTIGMLTGRETWGWPKVLGCIEVPDASSKTAAFTCSTLIFDPMAPDTQGRHDVLYSVKSKSAPALHTEWQSADHAGQQIIADLLSDSEEPLPEALRLSFKASAVALKQFRDVREPTLACYQAICDSPLVPTRFNGGGLFKAADFSLEITTCASHGIVRDLLGREPDPGKTILPIEWAMRADVDFKAPAGRVIAP
jgi:hypothetical protein